jgi:hypothetical protein
LGISVSGQVSGGRDFDFHLAQYSTGKRVIDLPPIV